MRSARAVLALLAFAAWSWWHLRHWAPDAALWPDQGAEISADDGPVSMPALKAIGAHFVYLDATDGGAGRDAAFARNLAEARAAGLRVGAVLRFDPCRPADAQSAAFALTVPRGRELLPPAIALDRVADECPAPVTEAAIESELMTLVNQVEAHAGRQVILQPSKAFEDRYRLAGRIERNLWVTGTWREPDVCRAAMADVDRQHRVDDRGGGRTAALGGGAALTRRLCPARVEGPSGPRRAGAKGAQ